MKDTGKASVLVFLLLQVLWITVNGQQDFTALENFLKVVWPTSNYTASESPCTWRNESFNCSSSRITEINLQAANLTGQVPPGTLSNLTELKSLDLSRNNLTGDLQGIDNLSQLVFLNLSWNELNGPVLQNVAKLTMLNTVDLSHNKFSGNISDVFRDLVKLKFLDLSSNSFDGTIPVASICKPQSLKTVNLSSNSFTGNILTQPTDRCSKLETLDLSFNKLDGNLPAEIFQSRSKLKALYLQMNNFNGNLSVGAGQGQSIVEINLESNSFSGLIPQALWQFPNLTILKLGKNNFSGSLNISTFPASLLELDLHSNSLSGPLPLLGQGLQVLDLSLNHFTGDFPSNLNVLSNLSRISLADNRFSSYSLPALGGLSKLEVLDLSGTNLTGTIPSSIGELNESLATLNLSRNSLGGDIPLELSTLKKLVLLDLSLNMLNGSISIPHSDGDLNETLTFLNLSRNILGGEIPLLMGTLKKLVSLDLSHNKLEGEIPPNMVDLTLLSAVDLSNNNLSGVIPDKNQWSTFPSTSFLNNPGLCDNSSSKVFQGIPSCLSPAPASSKSGKKVPLIIGLVSGFTVLLLALVCLIWCRVTRAVKPILKDEQLMTRQVYSGPMFMEKEFVSWPKGSSKDPHTIPVIMFEKPLLKLSFADLLQATANFSKELQIADCGFGPVYKGVLEDGTQLAIKVLLEVKFIDGKDAAARIEELANMKHPNLVALAGYCLVGEESLLIYEFMVNGDLHRWLHELPEGNRDPEDWSGDTWEDMEGGDSTLVSGENILDWSTRHKIALGAARALALLHHGCSPPIIHRDVKSSNILLDESFEAHLVNCGLAGIAKPNTPVMGGTVGYVPPEYGQSWQATPRGDVYSFGVVLLELVTGRKPTGLYFRDSYGGNLVGWVRIMVKDKKSQKALDRKIARKEYENQMLEVLRIGCLCTAETPAKRPTMQQVVGLLRDCQPGP
ncbi:hypothetical protein R1flu_012444 [Riccia fluitans]|uniref:Protein kinase domain-containing protein n=1 Tax=Riccia fluitans TaxID=41844 RepID=A0ABD1ZDZ7_9MARC